MPRCGEPGNKKSGLERDSEGISEIGGFGAFCDSEGGFRPLDAVPGAQGNRARVREREISDSGDGDNGEGRGAAARRSRLMLVE